ncbi:bifunctional helix-turn-helix transcriptional regulator/GNAT family N-acetyltransferase [Thaumasiovibrio subtropicus]|uniref:bifunctional helix-turn-helix transcriptional regulator/GNAT family N-acetyltransferase n=1 Tax=Thaumasiovibrio subtropicus TaxID=1891207 RepID=UPI000B363BA9|nr:bifunctional helix-turn-helix transcriptional regulator/GNAT family N-acetyltransferase [Thaumasiovibrio subtropicus]
MTSNLKSSKSTPPNAPQIRALSRELVRGLGMLDQHCGLSGITPVQAHALIEIQSAPLTVSELADKLRVDKSNASRANAMLINKGLVTTQHVAGDKRKAQSILTAEGRALFDSLDTSLNHQVAGFLDQLDADEIDALGRSLYRYQRAIQASANQVGYTLRPLTPLDNAAMAAVIRRVSDEHGLTADKGYSVADPTLDSLSECYRDDSAIFWVIEKDHRVLGGGGVAPLAGAEGVCELQKMYFLPELRGLGFARRIAAEALKFARQHGFKACYLETTAELKAAIALYESLGFTYLDAPLGDTGHDACEVRMLKPLI